MRVIRFEGAEQGVALKHDATQPEPGPGEALLRPIRVGITAEDVEIARGQFLDSPITLGHEFVATVEAVGAGSPDGAASLVGRRVVGAPTTYCAECDLCRSGLRDHCRSRSTMGVRGRDGCFADYFSLPVSNLLEVPDAIDDDSALLAGALADALHASRQVRLDTKPYITVLGEGPRALLCVQVMQRLNASVRLVTRREKCVELCDKWGVRSRLAGDIGLHADQDIVIDCTRSAEGFDLATSLVRPRGVIILKGSLVEHKHAGSCVNIGAIANRELTIVGSRCGSLGESIAALSRETYDVASLISRRMRLDDAIDALSVATVPGQTKVVMDV